MPPCGGPRTLSADLLNNNGTINVNQSASFSRASGSYTNAAAINIANGQTLCVSGGGQTFKQTAGTLTSTGVFSLSGDATFDYVGGTLAGNARL